MFKAMCSQCGLVHRAKTRSALLDKIRKHAWKAHRAWMRSRVKTGVAQRKDNPRIIGALEAPIIEKITGMPYEHVKSAVIRFMRDILLSALTGK